MIHDKNVFGLSGREIPGSAAPKPTDSGGKEIRQSLAYLFQSIRGKYSLETYLEFLGEFTDAEIDTAVCSGLVYRGGEAVFQTQPEDENVKITVSLEFQDSAGAWKLKKAERAVPKTTFTWETLRRMECAEKMYFEIQEPRSGAECHI